MSRWHPRGRPVFGLLAGLLTGLLITANLLLSSVVPLDHQLVVVAPPMVGLIGLLGGWLAPLRRRPHVDEQLEMEIERDIATTPTDSGLRRKHT